jgi:hypothetical protein
VFSEILFVRPHILRARQVINHPVTSAASINTQSQNNDDAKHQGRASFIATVVHGNA